MKNEEKEMPGNTETSENTAQKSASDKLDSLMNLSGELVITRARFTQLANALEGETALFKEIKSKVESLRVRAGRTSKALQNSSEKNAAAKTGEELEELIKLFEDIHTKIANSSIGKIANSLGETALALGKISGDIQTGVMLARMVTVKPVFKRIEEELYHLSKTAGKAVTVSVEGENTEMDKKITSALMTALLALARNAVEHGLETPEQRGASKKSSSGAITLKATHRDNSVVVEISDDGRGVDVQELARLAVLRKLLSQTQADALSDKEKMDLLLQPGLTESGSKAGLVQAHQALASVNGTVELHNRPGGGTTVTLKIPLSLTIIKALLVVISGETFAFPLNSVTEIIKVPVEEIYSVDQDATIKLRGHALSLIDLHEVVQIKRGKQNQGSAYKRIVIINNGEKKLGVEVDDLIGEGEVVIKPLQEYLAGVKGIAGAAILGDGTIALILDCGAVINMAK